MSNLDKKIKSELLVVEIEKNVLVLKNSVSKEQNINEILRNIILIFRKLDNLDDNKFQIIDDILFNNFMR